MRIVFLGLPRPEQQRIEEQQCERRVVRQAIERRQSQPHAAENQLAEDDGKRQAAQIVEAAHGRIRRENFVERHRDRLKYDNN